MQTHLYADLFKDCMKNYLSEKQGKFRFVDISRDNFLQLLCLIKLSLHQAYLVNLAYYIFCVSLKS